MVPNIVLVLGPPSLHVNSGPNITGTSYTHTPNVVLENDQYRYTDTDTDISVSVRRIFKPIPIYDTDITLKNPV